MRHRRDGFSRTRSLFYGGVTVAVIPEIVDGLVKGQPVKRLVVTADQHNGARRDERIRR
jgi:(2Fe-2S) ferredoxin